MKDQELLELCTKVFNATNWPPTDFYMPDGGEVFQDEIPLYTSDYILEKLPAKIVHDCTDYADADYYFVLNKGNEGWYTCYGLNAGAKEILHLIKANTPLKALLKLVITLHKAGELK